MPLFSPFIQNRTLLTLEVDSFTWYLTLNESPELQGKAVQCSGVYNNVQLHNCNSFALLYNPSTWPWPDWRCIGQHQVKSLFCSALLWPFYSSITSVQSSLMERLLLSSVVVSWMLILIEQCMRLFLVVDGDGVPPPLLTCHHLLCNAFHWRKGGFVLLLAVTKDLFSNDWWLGFMTTILLFLLGRIAPEDSLTDTRPGRERSVFSL